MGYAREALALWRGPPLADMTDEPFAAAEDPGAARSCGCKAKELAIDADLAAGRHPEDVLREVMALADRSTRSRSTCRPS